MSKEKLLEYLALNKDEDTLRLRLVMQSAPLLKKMKQSCILVVSSCDMQVIQKEFAQTDICCRVLHTSAGREIILLYRKEALEGYLRQKDVQEFLTSYGYHGSCLKDYLPLLKRRVASFYGKSECFPHEIGAFLGYPIEDVEGFIKYAGRNFLLSGYWKVYSDIHKAKERFRRFDEAKSIAAGELLAGKKLYEIAG